MQNAISTQHGSRRTHLFLNRTFSQFDVAFEPFALDAFRAPEFVFACHLSNERNGLSGNTRFPGLGQLIDACKPNETIYDASLITYRVG